MNELLKMLNALSADELDSIIMRATIMLEKKRKDEAEQAALLEKERQRQEKIAQEKKRQQEIAELQRKILELQQQSAAAAIDTENVQGENFVMHNSAVAASAPKHDPAPKPAPAPQPAAAPQTPGVRCPHCGHMNIAGSIFCESCGQNMTVQPKPAAETKPSGTRCPHCGHMNITGSIFCESCGQNMTVQSKPAAETKPSGIRCPHCGHMNIAGSIFCESCGQNMTVQPKPAAQSAPAPQTQSVSSQVKYIEDSLKKWEMLPGETVQYHRHDVHFIQPDMGHKYQYQMEITNKRILVTRMTAAAASAGVAFGLIGSLVRDATNAGPRPWLEIPLTAVRNCGLMEKKHFFIDADQTYVLKNKGYNNYIPNLVAAAKQEAKR